MPILISQVFPDPPPVVVSFDPTQIPWPLSEEFVPNPLSQRDPTLDEVSDQNWLGNDVDLSPVDAWDGLYVDIIPGATQRVLQPDEQWAGWVSSEAGPGDVVFDYFVPHLPPNVFRYPVLDETSDQAWLSTEADNSGVVAWGDFFTTIPDRGPPQLVRAEGADVSWSPDAVTTPFDPTQIPWPLSLDVQPNQPVSFQHEFWFGWISSEADLSPVDAWDDLYSDTPPVYAFPVPAEGADVSWSPDISPYFPLSLEHVPGASQRTQLDETSDQAWLSTEADSNQPLWEWYTDVPRLNVPISQIVEGADVSWSPDALSGQFDPTQIPWPLSVEPLQFTPMPVVVELWSGWLASEAGGTDTIFDYVVSLPTFTPLLGTADSTDVSWSPDISPYFDMFQDVIPGAIQRYNALDETSDQAWLSKEADPFPPFDTQYYEAQRPNPTIGTAESTDTSWSPDSFAPVFDPTLGPWPYNVEPILPLWTQRVETDQEFWAGWLSSEAGGTDAVFDYFVPPIPGAIQRTQLDETSDQAWLSTEADLSPIDAWDDLFVDSPPQWSALGRTDLYSVEWSPDAFTTPFDPTQIPWPLFLEAPQPQVVSVQVDNFDVSWSPDIAPYFDFFQDVTNIQLNVAGTFNWTSEVPLTVFDPTQIPIPLFFDAPPSIWQATYHEFWFGWISSEAGSTDFIFPYWVDAQRQWQPRPFTEGGSAPDLSPNIVIFPPDAYIYESIVGSGVYEANVPVHGATEGSGVLKSAEEIGEAIEDSGTKESGR